VVAVQKANESGCRFGHRRHGHRLPRDQWPVAVNRPLATTSIPAKAAKYSQIIMTVAFGPQTEQHQVVITRSFKLVSIIHLFVVSVWTEQDTLWAVRPNQ